MALAGKPGDRRVEDFSVELGGTRLRIQFTLALADYQAAQSLHWRRTPARRFVHFFIYEGLPTLAAGAGCVVAKRLGLYGPEIPYWVEAVLGMVVAIVYLRVTATGREARRYRKHFERKFSPDNRNAWIEINDFGISSAIVGTDAESFQWCKIVGFAQNEKMTLFYLTKKRFLLFPTPVQNSAQRAELADLIARHIDIISREGT